MPQGSGRVDKTTRHGAVVRADKSRQHSGNDRRADGVFGDVRAGIQGRLFVEYVYCDGEVCARQTLAHGSNDASAQNGRQQCERRHCGELYCTRVKHARAAVVLDERAGQVDQRRRHTTAARASGLLVFGRVR